VIRYPWDKTAANTLAFLDLPLHIVLMSQMKELKLSFEQQMQDMREQVKLDMVKEFNERLFGTDGYFETQRVIKRMEELHGNMLSLIGNRMVEANGLVAGSSVGGGVGESISKLQWRDEEEPP
jgi:hypothetical protein